MQTKFSECLDNVQRISETSRLERFLHSPFRYLKAILYRELIYPFTKKERLVRSRVFWNADMHMLLPSSTDIYLTGGKSHHSEIRLARFLMKQLKADDTFIDVGAHYGYFSLLAAQMISEEGEVHAFEAAPSSYQILGMNISSLENIHAQQKIVSDSEEAITFYEFSNLYSEYNTADISPYKDQDWFQNSSYTEHTFSAIQLSNYFKKHSIIPSLIKIDVEGGELKVLKGLEPYLSEASPIICMEYLAKHSDENSQKYSEPSTYQRAARLLYNHTYKAYRIEENGHLKLLESIEAYMHTSGYDSDNIVFQR